ncbi:acyl-CoA N-acyltransferase [Chaetomium sp. MPI-CAGE-AT-0009]|nr:acyl-CoA N-acyltransferase [Chaetomium sp. MPI-CAGE-AT-0009]
MGPQTIYLPDGQRFNVTPVFAGLFFKSTELSTHQNAFPIGWTIVIHTEDGNDDEARTSAVSIPEGVAEGSPRIEKTPHLRSFTQPTLQNDSLFISSISNPSNAEFKPAASPTRQIAMMLWVTLYCLETDTRFRQAAGDWRVRIKRDGMLRGRNLIPKLERMGLIASLNSAVGTALVDTDDMWANMFVTQSMFWQIPGRLFLFTLQPVGNRNPRSSYPGSPVSSRPGSPLPGEHPTAIHPQLAIAEAGDLPGAAPPTSLTSVPSFPISPFFSASHLPTYYPPPPLQYTITNHVRHPLRPKPPRMGEVFYTRFVPSAGHYLSFRVASISPKPVPYMGPVGPNPPMATQQQQSRLLSMPDSALLESWHANPRVSNFWGEYSPRSLPTALRSRHSFPVIGLWDGVPFGYFELYWVKEDLLGRYAGSAVIDDWDRGCHVLIGEEWARGRVQSWLTGLVHWIFCADYRTMSICLEPRVDNARFIEHLQYAGFTKEKEITFPHKQAWFGRLRRESWNGPSF